MIDLDQELRDELDRMTGPVLRPDWDAVLTQAGASARPTRRRNARRALLAVIAIAALCVATPLGATIANGIGGFSSWLTGEPGTPASKSAQEAFAQANARSWLSFPAGTRLRQLTTIKALGKTVDLLGFRAGDTLCLRVHVSGLARSGTQECAPLAALRQAGAPVRVVLVDSGFGKGATSAWYGLNDVKPPLLQITAGIAADGVRSITLHDQSGSHTVPVQANAFLYVAANPEVGQRVDKVSAQTTTGHVAVSFAPALFGFGSGVAATGKLTGPATVQRHVQGGTISWLLEHRPVGQPLSVLNRHLRDMIERHAVYGRVIAPDPGLPYRVAITLNTSPNGTKPIGVCTWLLGTGGEGGGGCQRLNTAFASAPITQGIGGMNGSSEYNTVAGLASDDVARITAYLSNGQTQSVALDDNAYFVELARATFPVRLVAFDEHGEIIGVLTAPSFRGFAAAPAIGRPTLIKRVATTTGGYVALYTGPSTTGGVCLYVKWSESKRAGGISQGCEQSGSSNGSAGLGLEAMGNPVFALIGRAPTGTALVILHYADGTTARARPISGYVIYPIPAARLEQGHQLISATATRASGGKIATQTFPYRPRRK